MNPRGLSRQEDDILTEIPLPRHWRTPCQAQRFGTLRWAFFNFLCIASLGHVGLERLWVAMKLEEAGDNRVWAEGMRQTCERLNNMLIVVRPHSLSTNRAVNFPAPEGEPAADHYGRLHHHNAPKSSHGELHAPRALHMHARGIRAAHWGHYCRRGRFHRDDQIKAILAGERKTHIQSPRPIC